MPLTLQDGRPGPWDIRKIGVIGPGIVGMPMAALLAHARVREGNDRPATVLVVQRRSATSGWKVDAINAGRSPIGGVEPHLDRIVAEAWTAGHLRATDDARDLRDADVVLVCVQTDKAGIEPDYGPLFEALTELAEALRQKPPENLPLIVFESTLAPSSMATVVREHFARFGLVEGRDLLLGNSPNRVMPGRLVERVAASDKLAAGLHPATPELIARLYSRIVTGGRVLTTNSLTAEIVKTLENAYRDVRIAYAAELVRHCDDADIDFYRLRDAVNHALSQVDDASHDPAAIPSGGLLVPTIGVGGHCLPKDGVLLWWRALERGEGSRGSLILEARRINDQSPGYCLDLVERRLGPVSGRRVAVLGGAYRPNSEDTRNSPSLVFARLLLDRGCRVAIHDPFVRPDDQNLTRLELAGCFTGDLCAALADADLLVVGTAHAQYADRRHEIIAGAPGAALFDACNLFRADDFAESAMPYAGLGRGRRAPDSRLVALASTGFRCVERGVANEVRWLVEFLNGHYARDDFNRASFAAVQRLAATCTTGCAIGDPGAVPALPESGGFVSRLASLAQRQTMSWD